MSDMQMFCFQCEQTGGGKGCTGKAGVCGKTSEVALLQDALTGALVGLAKNVEKSTPEIGDIVRTALFMTVTNVDFDADRIRAQTEKVRAVSGGKDEYDMWKVWTANEDIRSLKALILYGIRGTAAYAYHAAVLGETSQEVDDMFLEALRHIGSDTDGLDELLPMVLKVGTVNVTAMSLLDKGNDEKFGVPSPTTVSRDVEAGPAIIVSGHDLEDLKAILELTKDKGINVYTHGEMLPAHGYPELRKYPNLKGNIGTAWQNQRTELADLPAPIVYTTNCLMPPLTDEFRGRVFTTGPVGYPGAVNIGPDKDFTPVVEKALELGGFKEATHTGQTFTTGFGHGFILSQADAVVKAVKDGKISHFFLVGGCDGAKKSRAYYRELVEKTPKDSIILTLGCGKYKFNDLDLGTVAGLPRLMDMGQCNDSYGAVQVALALAKAFDCGVNDLPLSIILSWYEQKAVCVLLSLLALGVKNIRLGPTLPAFVSPNVLNVLVQNYNIAPIGTADGDLKAILG